MAADLSAALQFFHQRRFPEAEQACRRVLVDDPLFLAAWNLLGVIAFQSGRPAAAVAPLRRAVRAAPQGAAAFLLNLLMIGPPDIIAPVCRHLLALEPGQSAAMERLATRTQEQGDVDGGCVWIARALRCGPAGEQLLLNRMLLLQMAGRLNDGLTAARRLLACNPAHGMGWNSLGALALAHGVPGLAGPAFGRAQRLAPADVDAARGLARCALTRRATGDPPGRPGAAPPVSAPAGLLLRGPLTPVSGYGHMTCRFLDRLVGRPERPVQAVGLFGAESWPGAEAPVRPRVALHCLTPPVVEPVPGVRNVVFSMFEGTRIPVAWGRISAAHDMVIVPCEASRQAWLGRGYPADRLRICPLGVDPAPVPGGALAVVDRRGRPVSSYRHRILNVSDFIPRKNVDGLLRVWLTATRADDDAVLILKLGKGSAQSRAAIEQLLAQTAAAVGRPWEQAAAIAIVDSRLEEAEMDGLFRAATAYLSLSHGEGWDLPLTRAGALGLGLIAPRHSAYEDYLDDSVARMIPARVAPARVPYGEAYWAPFYGLDWWNPDEDAAADAVAGVIRDAGPALPDARPRLLGRFSWAQAAARLDAILDGAGA